MWLGLFLSLIGGASILAFRRPGIAISLMLTMFGLEQFFQSKSAIFVANSALVNYAVGFVGLIAGVSVILRHNLTLHLFESQKFAIALYGLAFLSQFWTLSPRSFENTYWDAIPYLVLFLIIGPVLLIDPRAAQDGIRWVYFIGAPLIILVVFTVEWSGRGIKMAAPVMYHGELSYSTPPLALATVAATSGIASLIQMPKLLPGKIFTILVVALCSYVIFRTQSRGQLLAFAGICILFFPIANRAAEIKGLVATFALFVMLAGAIYALFQSLDLGELNRWQESHIERAIEGRARMTRALLGHWTESNFFSLIFGLGASSSFSIAGFYVHNLPVEILCELGVFGMILFLGFCLIVGRSAVSIVEHHAQTFETDRSLIAAPAIFLFSFLLSFKEGALYGWPHLFFLGFVIERMSITARERTSKFQLRNLFLLK